MIDDGRFADIDMDSIETYTEKLSVKYAELNHLTHDLYTHLNVAYIRLKGDLYYAKSREKVHECLQRADKILGA